MSNLALKAQLYILTILGLGLVVFSSSLLQVWENLDYRLSYLAALAAVVSLFPVKTARSGRSGSVWLGLGDFFIFGTMLAFGPAAAALIGAIEGLAVSLKVKVHNLYKVLFNVCQVVLVAFVVGWLFPSVADVRLAAHSAQSLVALLSQVLLLAMLYLVLNALIVLGAMALVSKEPSGGLWKKGFQWGLPTNCINACTITLVFGLTLSINLGLTLALIPLILTTYFLREWVSPSETDQESRSLFTLRFFEDPLPGKAKGYILSVVVTTVPVYLYCVYSAFTLTDWNWLYLAGLTILATCFPFRLFSFTNRIYLTLGDVFVFAALLQFGPEVAVMVASIEAITFNLRIRPKGMYRCSFNLAQITLVSFLVGHLFYLLEAQGISFNPTQIGGLLALLVTAMACGLLYFLLGSVLTSLAMALARGQSFLQLWNKNLIWSYPSVLGACVGTLAYLAFKGLPFLS